MVLAQHLSDLCQKGNIEPIIAFLCHHVRGPSKDVTDGASSIVNPSFQLNVPQEDEEKSNISATQVPSLSNDNSEEGELSANRYEDLMIYQDNDGRTALHWAIALRNYALVEMLLESPYNSPVLTWDHGGCTPFLSSCMVGSDIDLIKRLLQKSVVEYPVVWNSLEASGAENTVAPEGLGNPKDNNLHSSFSEKPSAVSSPETVEQHDNDDIDEDKVGSQEWKCWKMCPLKRLDLSELRKSDEGGSAVNSTIAAVIINATERTGNSPVQTAVSRGNESLLAFLLENGGDFTVQNRLGQTALHRAASKGAYHLVEKLVLHSAAQFGGEKTSKHRQFVNTPDKQGNTALFYASMENNEEIGVFLLRHGANRDHKNKQGKFFYEV